MIIDNQELLITKCKFDMLCLNVWGWDSCSHYLLSIHCVENAKTKCCSRRKDILGVFSYIHRLDGLFYWKNTDSGTIICIVHTYVTIIRAGE